MEGRGAIPPPHTHPVFEVIKTKSLLLQNTLLYLQILRPSVPKRNSKYQYHSLDLIVVDTKLKFHPELWQEDLYHWKVI